MRSNFIIALVGFLLLVLQLPATPLPRPSIAAAFAAQDMNFTLEGKITAVNGDKLTVSTEENIIFHVRFSDTTEMKKKDGTSATAKDLRVGIRISVAGDLAESGEIMAKKIEIQTEAPQKKAASEGPVR